VTDGPWQALPCGADPELLVERAAEGAEAPAGSHEAGCVYCQAALREFAELWLLVRHWSKADVTVPRRFVATVISRARRIVESPRHAVRAPGRGLTTVTSWALGLIAATATEDTPGVSAMTGRLAGQSRRAASRCGADGVEIDEVDEGAISVALAVSAGPLSSRPVVSLADLADTVRHNVITAIADHTDLTVASVDVNIDDIDVPPR
jgi:uncharacterized alkaline shock family protein YloU